MIGRNAEGLPLYKFDRSRVECSSDCLRKYYWLYGFMGIGIVKRRPLPPYWPFLTGRYIHEGIESVILGMAGREAAEKAGQAYREEIEPLISAPEIEVEARAKYGMELEQEIDLVKGIVYGWSLTGYPRLVQDYEFIPEGIEHEEEVGWILSGVAELRLLTRTDILARSRQSGLAMLFNLKSTKYANERWRDSYKRDMQTLTEAIAVEARLGVKVDGVIIEGLVKGEAKEWPKGSGFYQYNNTLIYAWVKEQQGDTLLPGEEAIEFSAEYDYSCTSPHTFGNNQKCPGGRNHRLGKGWRKRAARECYPGGVFGWIDYLMRYSPQTLESYFIQLPPITRGEYEVERWKRQTLLAEKDRQDKAQVIDQLFQEEGKQAAFEQLDYDFPQTGAGWECSSCQYEGICWRAESPFDEDMWQGRVPNHPSEVEGLVQIESTGVSREPVKG